MYSEPAMRFIIFYLFWICLTQLSAIDHISNTQNLIVIIIDGLSNKLFRKYYNELSGFVELATNGVQADYLKPVFPSQSFPNWMSIFTGLYPENHGFTADFMWDENGKIAFLSGEGPNDTSSVWWYDRPAPLWYTIGKSDIDVHCYWVPGCHQPHVDLIVQVPSERRFNASNNEQTESLPTYFPSIIERIFKYQSYRQQFFLMRYGGLKNAIKTFGSESHETAEAIKRADLHLLDIQRKLEQMDLFKSTNIIVLSDHGMSAINSEYIYYIDECFEDLTMVHKVVNLYSLMMIFTDEEHQNEVLYSLQVCDQFAPQADYEDEDEVSRITIYRTNELPDELHWRESKFMPSIVLIAKPGAAILTRQIPSIPVINENDRDIREASGYDHNFEDMHGIFLARGSAFKVDQKSNFMNMVDVYQMILNILAIESPHKHNGTWSNVENLLDNGWELRSTPLINSCPTLYAINFLILSLFPLLISGFCQIFSAF